MGTILKNNIPAIIEDRNLNISDLHNLLAQDENTRLSYPAVQKIASKRTQVIADTLSVGTLRKIATALKLSLNDLVEIVRDDQVNTD